MGDLCLFIVTTIESVSGKRRVVSLGDRDNSTVCPVSVAINRGMPICPSLISTASFNLLSFVFRGKRHIFILTVSWKIESFPCTLTLLPIPDVPVRTSSALCSACTQRALHEMNYRLLQETYDRRPFPPMSPYLTSRCSLGKMSFVGNDMLCHAMPSRKASETLPQI